MKAFFTFFAYFLFSFVCFSQLEPTGYIPGSGYNPKIYADESVVLASINGRLLRSTDDGNNWHQVVDGLGPGAFGSRLIAKADGVLFLGSNERDHLYRSVDNGASWHPANSGIEDYLIVQNLATISSTEGNVFIGHNLMLRHSTDEGISWQETELSNSCTALAGLGEEIWVAQENQVYYSEDNGENWNTLANDPDTHPDASVTCFSAQGDRIFAGLSYDTNSALKYTDDHGQNWEAVGGFSLVQKIISNGQDLFLLSQGSIYHSDDSGENWVQLPQAASGCLDISVVGDQIWVATISGPIRIDYELDTLFEPEITLGRVNSLESIGQTLFCLSYSTLYKSDDNGGNWGNISSNIPSSNAEITNLQSEGDALLISRTSQTEFAALSEDQGQTFEEIPLTPHGTAAQQISEGRLISFSYIDHTFWYSDDNGNDWQEATSIADEIESFVTINCLSKFGDNLIAGFENGVAVSTNNGEHWNFHAQPEWNFLSLAGWQGKAVAIVQDPQSNDYSILKSLDNGESWTEIESGFAPQSSEIQPQHLVMMENRIYCSNGTSPLEEDSGKIFGLNDSGSWFEIPELGVPPMEMLSMTKTDFGIFAGLKGYGVWFTENVDLGIDSNSEERKQLTIYPNPTKESVSLKNGFSGNYLVQNMKGQIVLFGLLKTPAQGIDIRSLTPGIYLFTLKNEDRFVTTKFVVE